MTMNTATTNTMKFFDEVLEAHLFFLHRAMAEAVTEMHTERVQASALNAEGELVLLRLCEIWAKLQPDNAVTMMGGTGPQLMMYILDHIYAHIIQHPLTGTDGLAICLELNHLVDGVRLGEWFE